MKPRRGFRRFAEAVRRGRIHSRSILSVFFTCVTKCSLCVLYSTTPWSHTSINDCPRPSVQMAECTETLSFTRTLSTNGRDPKLYWDPKYKWQRPSVQIQAPSLERTWPRFLFLHQRGSRKSDAGSIHSQCTLSWRRAFLAVPGRPERALQRAHRHGNPMDRGRHGTRPCR